MKRYWALILKILILVTSGILLFRGCRYDWSPHYLGNSAVTINKKLFSPDTSVAVVYYTLDVGARGERLYKSLLRTEDYDDDLLDYNIPPEIVIVNWKDNKNLEVIYDPSITERVGSLYRELDLSKDTIAINGVNLIVIERKNMRSR